MKYVMSYFIALLLFVGCQQSGTSTDESSMQTKSPSIVGAWEIVEYSGTSPDSTWKEKAPYRSVILFTKNYYSTEIARVERPSWPQRPQGDRPSCEEISNAYNGLTSNSGKYEIRGDSIYYNVLIAKSPNYMNDNPTQTFGIKLEGDKLTITMKGRREGVSLATTHRRLE